MLYAVLIHLPLQERNSAGRNAQTHPCVSEIEGVELSAVKDELTSMPEACRPVFAGL